MKILILLIGLCIVSIVNPCRHTYDIQCDPYGRRCRRVKRPWYYSRRTILCQNYPPTQYIEIPITRLIEITITRYIDIPITRTTEIPITRPTEKQVTRFTDNPITELTDNPISTPKWWGSIDVDCDYAVDCDIENSNLRYCCEQINTVIGKVFFSRIFLEKCKSELKNASEAFLKTQQDIVQTQYTDQVAIFNTFIEYGRISGEDISECVDTKTVEMLKTLVETMRYTMELAIEDRIKTAGYALDEKTTLMERIKDKLDNLYKDLSDCDAMNGASKKYCETSLRDKVSFLDQEVTEQIDDTNKEAYDIVYINLESYLLPPVVTDRLSRISLTGEMMIDKAMSCIKMKYFKTARMLRGGMSDSCSRKGSITLRSLTLIAVTQLILKQETVVFLKILV